MLRLFRPKPLDEAKDEGNDDQQQSLGPHVVKKIHSQILAPPGNRGGFSFQGAFMSYNGSGTFSLVAGNPVVTGTTISSTWANDTLNDIATGLSTAITKDGQTTPTANIPMGGYKITGLGAPAVNGDALRFEDKTALIASQQSQLYTAFTTGGTSTAYTLTPAPAITAYAAGQSFWVTFNAASGADPTLAISGVATPPNLVKQIADGTYANVAANDIPINHRGRVTLLSATQALVELPQAKSGANSDITSLAILPGYLFGCTFSTAGSSATMSIAAGRVTDSTGLQSIPVSALDKTTSNFVAGTAAGGKFRAAAIANNATYHWYAVYSPTTGESDIGFSTVATGLVSTDYVAGGGNLPDKFTMFAYLKPWRTNGSAQWVSWIERGGNFFEFVTPILDIDHVVTVTTAVTEVLASVPTGVKVKVKFAGGVNNGSAANLAYFRFSALDTADLAPNSTTAPLAQQNYSISATGGSEVAYATHEIWTDTAASIRGRVSAAAAAISIRVSVEGFYFYR